MQVERSCRTCIAIGVDAGVHPCVECKLKWTDAKKFQWIENPAITELRSLNIELTNILEETVSVIEDNIQEVHDWLAVEAMEEVCFKAHSIIGKAKGIIGKIK